MTENKKAKVQSELEKAQQQFDTFDKNIKDMTHDRMNAAPKQEVEPQTKLSTNEIRNSKDIYLKPERSIMRRDKFNEKFRDQYNFEKEQVCFIAENKEIIGEAIELWTGKYGGVPVEFWKVPVNKPVWGPRYLAEQIKKCSYHRLTMQQNVITESGGYGQMYGALAVDTVVQRLDAMPASTRKSLFMGASGF
jgi:hypothetical protein